MNLSVKPYCFLPQKHPFVRSFVCSFVVSLFSVVFLFVVCSGGKQIQNGAKDRRAAAYQQLTIAQIYLNILRVSFTRNIFFRPKRR